MTDPGDCYARAYDMVLNGCELGGGSIRISDTEIQDKMLQALGLSEEVAQARFGFLLDAEKYGVPPHGGMAFGLDILLKHRCSSCNKEFEFDSWLIKCPECKSETLRRESGNEFLLESIEVDNV